MTAPTKDKDSLTDSQRKAVESRGNVLVMAGAGTGKTHTLITRCLDCIDKERARIDEILVVTFTEAAAAEMKQRLRGVLEKKARDNPDDPHWGEQLMLFDAAHIGTLHSFCFRLVCEHFYELGLDPRISILDEGQARLLAGEVLDGILQEQYAGEDAFSRGVQNLIQIHGGGRDESVRKLVLQLHNYSQARPDAAGWLATQIAVFTAQEPPAWLPWLLEAIRDWRDTWLPVLEDPKGENGKNTELTAILTRLPKNTTREIAANILEQIIAADADWPRGTKKFRKPVEEFFDDAKFLLSLVAVKKGTDPLAEDWSWIRGPMEALLRLTQSFAARFADRKRDDGVLDFHDLEQFALKLLWDFATDKPTPAAKRWREKLRFVFVDEYQDINAAQDKIIAALSRDGAAANRFLVGDVKQSIYRFRLADPKIFRDYAKDWRGKNGQIIPLTENFRSRESLLQFVNSVFRLLMREEIGGVNYDGEAELKFGSPESRHQFSATRTAPPCAELLLRLKKGRAASDNEEGGIADLDEAGKEARLLAFRLRELKESGHEIWDDEAEDLRPADWRDMAVLLRSPAGKAEVYAKQFELAGVPLVIARGGFYDSGEILDLLSLLELLDNPLQDVPAIAVLRSPLAGCSLDELAEIRLAAGGHFWFAINQAQSPKSKIRDETRAKVGRFLERFQRWRKLARQLSLSQCLEEVLAETHYADWLRAQPRGAQRRANLDQFLNLAQKFDQLQRQGLFRFLKFIEAQREAGAGPEIAAVSDENAVRLLSIHQSKGLEFPVVAVADLAKPFNFQDLRGEIILDEEYGLCPRVQPPQTGARYPSLPHWLAQRHQRRELCGEELRLLYVAMTRARDTLILSASIPEKKWETTWTKPGAVTSREIVSAKSCADWLGLWFSMRNAERGVRSEAQGELPELRWRIVEDPEPVENAESGQRKVEMAPLALDGATVERLRERLGWTYPFLAATEWKAKSSVTALRREAENADEEAEQIFTGKFPRRRLARTLTPPGQRSKLSAAEIGAAHHKFLQHVALEKAGGRTDLAAEVQRLEQEKILSAEEKSALDLSALAEFWVSPAGRQIRAQPANIVKRELPFTAKFSPAELAKALRKAPPDGLESEFVVVQGVADLVVLLPDEIWLLDFKTDEVSAPELPEKTRMYSPQLKLYAAALAKIYSRRVTHSWLHFLTVRKTVEIL